MCAERLGDLETWLDDRPLVVAAKVPVGASGDSEPAFAPLPTMIAIRKSGTPARAATIIAIGASMAAAAMLPGPTVAIAAPRTKNMIGINPAFPLQIAIARCAIRSSVPLISARLSARRPAKACRCA